MEEKIKGGCLCGRVRYEANFAPIWSAICFCRQCQKAAGAECVQLVGVPAFAFSLTQGNVKFHESVADSGNKVRRGFCEACGSHLSLIRDAYPDIVTLRTCSLDEPGAYPPQFGVFTESAQSWTWIPTDIPTFATVPASPEELQSRLKKSE